LKTVVKFFIAQVGAESGGGEALRYLIGADELPWSDWESLVDHRTMRPGVVGFVDATDVRAKEIHSVMALRRFTQTAGSRSLVIWILPLASIGDARTWVSHSDDRATYNEHVLPDDVDRLRIADLDSLNLDSACALRIRKVGKKSDEDHDVLILSGSVDHVAFQIRCLGPRNGWSLDDVMIVAALQAHKIAEILASDGSQQNDK
jgi:hypothetical protein